MRVLNGGGDGDASFYLHYFFDDMNLSLMQIG